MQNDIKRAYSEVYCIIELLEEDFKNKLPIKLIDFFKNEKDITYIPKIELDNPLEEQELLQDTINLLAMLKLNYWCNEDEKKELLNLLNENEHIYQEQLKEKYNPDNLFKKIKIDDADKQEITQQNLIEYKKKNFFIQILKKVKKLLVKK